MTAGFFLMTEKGLRVLEAVIAELGASTIAYVVGARDPNVSRDYFTEIAGLCAGNGIQFYERHGPPPGQEHYTIAISWRWMIRDVPNLIILHDSLLPKYRGFAPLPTALIKGEPAIGVTALFANEEFDRGDIIGQRRIAVAYPIKIREAISRISQEYSHLVIDMMKRVAAGQPLTGRPQEEHLATYSLWRDEEDYRIDWNRDAAYIKRLIDSVGDPYKGAASLCNGVKVRIDDAEEVSDVVIEDRHPGKVIFLQQGNPVVVCGSGLLRLTAIRDDATQESLLPWMKLRSRLV